MTNLYPSAIPTVAPEAKAASLVLLAGQQMAHVMLTNYQMAYDTVWNNRLATPDKVVAALGTNAKAVFEHSAALVAFLTGLGLIGFPVAIPAGWTLTVHEDGSMVAAQSA